MSDYDCLVREDFILNNTYICNPCKINQKENSTLDHYNYDFKECRHKTVSYGPCRDGQQGYGHVPKDCGACPDPNSFSLDYSSNTNCDRSDLIVKTLPDHTSTIANESRLGSNFHDGCRYRTFLEDYEVTNRNTEEETIFINKTRLAQYHEYSIDSGDWMHLVNIKRKEAIENRTLNDFTPCPYYDQLNRGLVASHTIFNYANFLIFLRSKNKLRLRKLLVLEEGHQIENQVVEHVGINITKRTLQKYITTTVTDLFELKLSYESDMLTEWVVLLDSLYSRLHMTMPTINSGEIRTEAKQYLKKLEETIGWIKDNPNNWIVSEIVYEDHEDPNNNPISKTPW